MKLHQVYDDLGEFVAAFRGGISREAIRIDLDERHVPGTVLEIDLALADGLSLVKGRAAVVDVRPAPRHAAGGWRTVLQFSSLEPDSRDFLDRLERRHEAEGEPVFRPDLGPPPAATDEPPDLTDTGALEVALLDLSGRPTVRERAAPIEERDAGATRRTIGARIVRSVIWIVSVAAVLAAAAAVVWLVRPDLLLGMSPVERPSTSTGFTPAARPQASPVPSPTGSTDTPTPVTQSPVVPSPEILTPRAALAALRATGLESSVDAGSTLVRISVNQNVLQSAVGRFRMDGDPGPREVLVIRGVSASDLPLQRSTNGPHVSGIRTWLHEDRSPPELHVVLDLTGPGVSADEPRVEGRVVTVRVR